MKAGEPYEVVIERNGKQIKGLYRINSGKHPMLTVSYGGASKPAVLHQSPPEVLARIMLRELVEEEERLG